MKLRAMNSLAIQTFPLRVEGLACKTNTPMEEEVCLLYHQYVIKTLEPPQDNEVKCQTTVDTN
jgi:hypothetical protein